METAIEVRQPSAIVISELKQMEDMIALETGKRKLLTEFIANHMKDGVDYGKIHVASKEKCSNPYDCKVPGHWSKDTLFKSGAEKFVSLFKITVQFSRDEDTFDMAGRPVGLFCYICTLISPKGEAIAYGRGSCDAASKKGDMNTAIKIAQKRAQVDAVLRFGALSDFFTQDLEDSNNEEKEFNPHTDIIHFGKHKGKKWIELPDDYLKWMQSSEGTQPDTLEMVKKTLDAISKPAQESTQAQSVQTENGINIGKEFDPQNECIKIGKYAGTVWADIPQDYLNWYVKNMKGEGKTFAEATLKWLSQRQDIAKGSSQHKGDVVSEMFPNQERKPDMVEVIEHELNEVARTLDVTKIIEWGNRRRKDINSLSKEAVVSFKKSFEAALKQAKAVAQKGVK
ncbi:MAG: hypothetical protein EPO24_02200 [Bacteroidetes bacterium]|nr:MAG: hypothetical protein EPO24_02200 [Bacteroidota bacterium]